MKKILLILFFIFFSLECYSQKNTTDTNQICVPQYVAKEILLDLNELDRLKKIVEKDKDEINQLNTKIKLLENTNNLLIEKDSLSLQIIKVNEEKFQIIEKENEDLRKSVKKIKQKNIIVESVAGTIVAALTYILVFK